MPFYLSVNWKFVLCSYSKKREMQRPIDVGINSLWQRFLDSFVFSLVLVISDHKVQSRPQKPPFYFSTYIINDLSHDFGLNLKNIPFVAANT